MKRITTLLLTIIMTISMIFSSAFSASAVEPRLSNANDATVNFTIEESTGIGHFSMVYTGTDGVFTYAKVTVKVEKRTLWLFWSDIETWTETCTELDGHFYHAFTLDGSGTYRASFTLEFYGTSGTTDVIENSIKDSY